MQNGWFFHIIEGPAKSVTHLLTTITDDHRNADLRVLFDREVSERVFTDWSVSLTSNHSLDLRDFMEINDFASVEATPDTILPFFRQVVQLKTTDQSGQRNQALG